jgi:hypothetical protein
LLLAQEQTGDSASATPNGQKSSPPLLPLSKSPVEIFRELLAQNPAERAAFLAKRTPESQKLIVAKLQEYESLPPEQRELRLQVTELRWYLLPLMKAPVASRSEELGRIPEGPRKLVQDRLDKWDKLPAEVQKQVLDNEDILRYYVELAAKSGKPSPPAEQTLSATQRHGIQQWQAFTEQERQKIKSSFDQFFNLTPQEQQRALHTLSGPEREQIDKTLQTFGHLTVGQRSECLRSFEKFASLNVQERQDFLKSAERWQAMSPTERQSWKDLVYKLSRLPPVPPGLGFPPVPRSLAHPARELPGAPLRLTTNGQN